MGPPTYSLTPGDYGQAPGTAPAPAPAAAAEVYRWKVSSICSENGYSSINKKQYLALSIIHVINAVMYGASWIPWLRENAKSRSTTFLALLALPEVLNVVEAALYLASARHYGHSSANLTTYASSNEYRLMHRLELAASLIEMVASFGWTWSWWATHERGPGRGLSIFDLDLWSTALLVASSGVYVAYNVQITRAQGEGWWGVHHDPTNYSTNHLYVRGDVMYFVGACLYLFAAMRDCDCWFWLPSPVFGPSAAPVIDAPKPPPDAESPPVADLELTRGGAVAASSV